MKKKNAAAVSLAKQRARSLTPERRKEIASSAAKAKWAKVGKSPKKRREAVEAAAASRRKVNPDSD